MSLFVGLLITGLAVFLATVAVVPTAVFFTGTELNETMLINSTCHFTVSLSDLLRYLKFSPDSGIDLGSALAHLPQTLSVRPQILYRIMKRLGGPMFQWPPKDVITINATTAKLASLLPLLLSPPAQAKNDCHADASYDPSNGCCFMSCSRWNWLTPSEETADEILFYTNVVLSVLAVFISTTTVIIIETQRRFPHIMIAWYLCLAVSVTSFIELIGRVMGRANATCCGSKDLAEAITKNNCNFVFVYIILNQFFYLVTAAWFVLGAANVAFIIGLPHLADSFFAHLNLIHVIESLLGWGLPAVLAALPYAIKGKDAYNNFSSICFTCFVRDADLQYYTFVLPVQIFFILMCFLLGWLAVATRRKQRERRRIMGESNKISKNVQELEDVQRRFMHLVGLSVFVGLCFVINYSILFANSDVIQKDIERYWQCVLVNAGEEECSHGAHTRYFTMMYMILNRLALTLALAAILRFFFMTKDIRRLWAKALRLCHCRVKTTQSKSNSIEMSRTKSSSTEGLTDG